jgi:hypothetical protein
VLGGGHHAIQETAIGKTRYDAAKKPAPARRCKPELPNLHTPMSPPGR